jgi:hypothetical protein
MIHGKCLCGEITYTLASELLYLYHCHCVECRRFSGGSPIYSQAEQGGEFTSLHCGAISNPPDKALDANFWVSEKCPRVSSLPRRG